MRSRLAVRALLGCTLAVLLGGCALPVAGHRPGHTRLAVAEVRLPFAYQGGRASIDAEINGRGPFPFEIDTGSSVFVVSPRLADELDLARTSMPGRVHGATGSEWVALERADLERVGLGAAEFEDVGCWVLDIPGDSDGLIGLGLFSETLVTLDFPARTLRIREGSLPPPDGREVLAYEIEGGVPVLPLEVQGVPVRLGLDTGFGGWLRVTPETEAQLRFRVAPEHPVRVVSVHHTTTDRLGRLDGRFRLGGHSVLNPPVQVGDGAPLLGARLLAPFAVTFDPANRRVRFGRPGPPALR